MRRRLAMAMVLLPGLVLAAPVAETAAQGVTIVAGPTGSAPAGEAADAKLVPNAPSPRRIEPIVPPVKRATPPTPPLPAKLFAKAGKGAASGGGKGKVGTAGASHRVLARKSAGSEAKALGKGTAAANRDKRAGNGATAGATGIDGAKRGASAKSPAGSASTKPAAVRKASAAAPK